MEKKELLCTAGRIFVFKDCIHSFMRDTGREAETQAEGEADSLRGSLMLDLIPGPRDHALGSTTEPPRGLEVTEFRI